MKFSLYYTATILAFATSIAAIQTSPNVLIKKADPMGVQERQMLAEKRQGCGAPCTSTPECIEGGCGICIGGNVSCWQTVEREVMLILCSADLVLKWRQGKWMFLGVKSWYGVMTKEGLEVEGS